ncbi:Serine phosphatase RsbU, regulator of sigma subunit [Streptomyces sp. OV198]|uniref:SpoIIE family protein phosphatase n=1 Tax=Streptomyces sp. OV198 TaxID=1882787 RepID=UPI000BD8846B|nr:SpoIIE family protein phosphatase [Streptomyces sp. OV198]SOF02367.1 Serine phosphatase RsbU, regulator of sigma subunit [Streptomyces sp. OV198]
MTSSRPGRDPNRGGASVAIHGADLTEVLYCAAREARRGLNAVAAGVYMPDEREGELRLALAGGSMPSCFTLPGRMGLDTPSASVQAWQTGEAAVLIDPNPTRPDRRHVLPYPYTALSVPVTADDRRFGVLTVLRPETSGDFSPAERTALGDIGSRLADALARLAGDGISLTPGLLPTLIPPEADVDTQAFIPGWGVRDVPGSTGASMMYPLRRLAELLNRAATTDEIVAAARYCVMSPLHARALVLLCAKEGRLWVLGHSGDSSRMVRDLHGTGLDARTPAAEAFEGRPLCVHEKRAADNDPLADDEARTELFLPLVGDGQFIDLPLTDSKQVVGVCCLSFSGPRGFPPEERALLGMMAGLLGAAVERVRLNARQREVARCLQRFLLPTRLPDLPRLATTARYRPADVRSKAGGDWYDVLRLPNDRAVMVVGDVEGHSMESAAVMGQVRTAVASYATEGHRPTTVIDRTGGLLADLGTDLTVTCCVVALDTLDGIAEVALAGHPAPLVRRPDGSIGVLDAPANLPLGVCAADPCQGREHSIGSGSVLMLYTNGLVGLYSADPQDCARELLGSGDGGSAPDLERLADAVVAEFCTPQMRRDDAALLLARYEGAQGQDEPRTAGLHIRRRDLRGVRDARGFVHDHLGSWGLEDLSDPLELIVSEIVTNALVHAGSDVDVRLRAFPDRVRLEVRDSDSNPPVPSPLALAEEENAEAEHGRGMLIVQTLAEEWVSSPNGRGKTVSLTLPISS